MKPRNQETKKSWNPWNLWIQRNPWNSRNQQIQETMKPMNVWEPMKSMKPRKPLKPMKPWKLWNLESYETIKLSVSLDSFLSHIVKLWKYFLSLYLLQCCFVYLLLRFLNQISVWILNYSCKHWTRSDEGI